MNSLTCKGVSLFPASFRGVPFWVESDKEEYGRRIVTHEYPTRDQPFNEDLGEKAQKFSVTAYVAGDGAKAQKEALVAAARMRGSAMLALPAKAPFLAVLNTLAVSRSKDEQGFFRFQIEFTADPMGGMPGPLGMFEALIGGVMTGIVAPLTAVFNVMFVATSVLPYVMENAVSRIVNFSGVALDAVEGVSGSTQTALTSQITTNLIGLAQNANALVRPGPADPRADSVITTLGDVFYDMVSAYRPNDLIPAMLALSAYTYLEGVDSAGRATYGNTDEAFAVSTNADARNAAALNGAIRSFALVGLASAMSAATFSNRSEAVQARATLVEMFGQQLDRTDDEETSRALVEARNHAVKAISQNAANLAPVITVVSPISLNSLYWAGRLYQDATQAEALADRNNVPTPAYMPTTFEAIAST